MNYIRIDRKIDMFNYNVKWSFACFYWLFHHLGLAFTHLVLLTFDFHNCDTFLQDFWWVVINDGREFDQSDEEKEQPYLA